MVRCLIVSHYAATERFIVDTGAAYTCCYYKVVNKKLKENMFRGCEFEKLGGIVNGNYGQILQISFKAIYHREHRYR